MSDPLDTTNLLRSLLALLPRASDSPLRNPTDAIAALVHTIHTALDFRLINPAPAANTTSSSNTAASGEEEDTDDAASETATAVDQDEGSDVPNQLAEGWNARGEDSYVFEYRHEQSSMVFRVRIGRMGGRVQIDAMAEDGAPNNLSIVLGDLITPAAFPIPGSATAPSAESSSSSAEAPAKSVGFKSSSSVKNFVDQYKRDIISKLLPGLRKEGYTESASTPQGSDPRNPPPSQPPHYPPPARSDPLLDPLHPSRSPFNPASIGHRDLDPLASFHPPGRGGFDPEGSGGGMYVDFTHPLFDSRRRIDPDLGGGPGGMIQPPGARWDPVGPGMGGGPGGNPLGGMGVGDDRWGDEMLPPGQFGPDLGRMGGLGGPRGGGRGGRGGFGGGMGGMGGMGGLGGGRFGGGGGGGGFGGGGGMYM